MSQQASKRQENTPSKKKQRSVMGTLINLVLSVLLLSLLAWFFLGVGFGMYQLMQGKEKAQTQINSIIKSNTEILKSENHFLLGNAYIAFETGEKNILESFLIKKPMLNIWQWSVQKMQQGRELTQEVPQLAQTASNIWHHIFYPLFTVFLGSALIVGTRLFIFLLSLPLFLLLVGFGLVDGLVQRDVRKFQAARESTYLFHRIKKAWKSCFFMPLFFYFVWPFVIHPLWFLMPIAIVLGLMMQLSFQSFKKYV